MNNGKELVIGIDIGGTNTRIGLVSDLGELLDITMFSSEKFLNQENQVEILIREIQQVLEVNKILKPTAISLGIPSLISNDGNAAMSTPNLNSLDGVDIITPLRKSFFCPVYLNKDSNLQILYKMVEYEIDVNKTVIGIFFGTGIGNGVWVNGKMLQGRNSAAGELGHIPIWKCDIPCVCGNQGCIEGIVSGKRLEEICKEYFSNTEIQNLFTEHWPHHLLEEFVQNMALPVATEINIFNPDYIFLGGGIIYMKHFPKDMLKQEIIKKVRKPSPAENINIIFAKSQQEAGVLGAAYYALKELAKEGSDY